MSELMALNGANEVLTMSSREIAELTGKRHDNVCRDIRVILSELYGGKPDDYIRNSNLSHLTNQSVTCRQYDKNNPNAWEYLLDRRHTEILITGYDILRRTSVIDRWFELEKQVRQPALPDFTDPVAAARAWADEVEQKLLVKQENERLALVNKQLAPKAAICDAIVKNDMHRTASEVAKPLGMSAVKLNRKLSAVGVYDLRCRRRVFSQWFIDEGYGEMRVTHDGYEQAVFTAKGQVWITELLTCN
ncbi:Rha family transcriptional regulator [Escherichia coli]|uniref:Rha family transcriptional regulator n=1 Tax=Escherichia coli TaxID=562 RepID=UPI00266688F3|nr:Rha family transcriptional regulator [Escherichia coli]MDO2848697.1 Rha family transcriptional regulator [Escherichia coli]